MPDLDYILEFIPQHETNGRLTSTGKPLQHVHVKVALIGAAQTGKSALCDVWMDGEFPLAYQATLGARFKLKIVPVGENMMHLHLLDLGGKSQYQQLLQELLGDIQLYVFVFDLTDRESFGWIEKKIPQLRSGGKVLPAVLVGNRVDLPNRRKIAHAQGQALADGFGYPYVETSAKSKHIASDCFRLIAKVVSETQLNLTGRLTAAQDPLTFPQPPPRSRKPEQTLGGQKHASAPAPKFEAPDEDDEF